MQLFAKFKWHSKEALVGAVDADIEALCDKDTPVPLKALMRNAARVANAASNALLATGTSQIRQRHTQDKLSCLVCFLHRAPPYLLKIDILNCLGIFENIF